ncbi:MAG: hypothetical protein C0601_07550 [Candidatus Muiribacterium halophilum]|uniref:Uncharacterized protein n=1 Tax=Muiribacterium halophilum TaxID=2053465 RepID=A0A2N5ZFE7_MUIH1|nr:MAG: hypothetical protein C0601_07550 [Candidatus Muirbacterium halophilum]
MKRTIPLIITFLSALVMIIIYFINPAHVQKFENGVFEWIRIIGAFALFLGLFNLLISHFIKVRRNGMNAVYSIALIVAFFAIVISGIFFDSENPDGTFQFMFNNIYRPLSSTMFSLLAFYVASAAFRAFRAKTKEASFLLVAAFIVMLGRVPIGTMIWGKIPVISNWIMAYPAAAAQSAIMIGAALGAISVSLKIMLGIERTYLGGEE